MNKADTDTGEIVTTNLPTTIESHVPTTLVDPVTALEYIKLAGALFDSGLYDHLGNKSGVLASILDGVEKGIGMMTALQNMVVINKKLAYSANLVMALAKQRAGVTWKVIENNTKGCKMQFNRPGFDSLIVSFTEADAQAAGLIRPNSGYTKYPADMYFARCGVKGCRRIAPDATCNLYSIEELTEGKYTSVDEVPDGGVVEVEGFGGQPQSRVETLASKGRPESTPSGKQPASQTAKKETKGGATPGPVPNGSVYVFKSGKHEGEKITDVPRGYIQWMVDNFDDGFVKSAAIKELERRDKEEGPVDYSPDTAIADLQKLPKDELVQRALKGLAVAYEDDTPGADVFLAQAVTDNILADANVGSDKNNKGHLARFIVRLREQLTELKHA